MGKILFWLVVFFVVLFALRLVNVAKSRSRDRAPGRPPKAIEGSMSRCVDCGVYLPSADAIAGPRGPLCGDPQCAERRKGHGG
jgi:hypothetical protein